MHRVVDAKHEKRQHNNVVTMEEDASVRQEEEEGYGEGVHLPEEEDTDVKGRQCDWCFRVTRHELMHTHVVSRNDYRCRRCQRDTAKCMKCGLTMCRRYGDGADKLCLRCSGCASSSGSASYAVPDVVGPCSHCMRPGAPHRLYRARTLRRNEYVCVQCGEGTLKCRKCGVAMARNSSSWSDELCALCFGTVQAWGPQHRKGVDVHGRWCSWCMTKSKHCLQHVNVTRNVYTCEECSNRTLKCMKCKIAMTRGGATWDDSLCACCKGESSQGVPQDASESSGGRWSSTEESWASLERKKDLVAQQSRDLERVRAELSRSSTYRCEVFDKGLLKPFLLLIAMPPQMRNQCACALGFSLYTQSYFGDPHAEAYHILCTSAVGMVSRCVKSYERVNVFARRCNWVEMLSRVCKSAFDKCSTPLPSSAMCQKACQRPRSRVVQQMEEEFLLRLIRMIEASEGKPSVPPSAPLPSCDPFTPPSDPFASSPRTPCGEGWVVVEADDDDGDGDAHDNDAHVNDAHDNDAHDTQAQPQGDGVAVKGLSHEESESIQRQYDVVKDRVRSKTGMDRNEIMRYSVSLAKAVLHVPGTVGQAAIALQAIGTYVPGATTAVAMSTTLATLATPLAIVGAVGLAVGGVQLLTGSSEERLLVPVVLLLNQMLLLAIEGVDVCDGRWWFRDQ